MLRFASALFVLMFSFPVVSQTPPSPLITPDSVGRLSLHNRIGSELPGELAFSPDGQYMVVGTSEQAQVYQTDNLSAALNRLPISGFEFDGVETVTGEGQRWSLETGLSIGVVPTVRGLPPDEIHPTTRIEIVQPSGEILLVDTQTDHRFIAAAVTSDYATLAVALGVFDPARLYSYRVSIYLYNLPGGDVYAIHPQNLFELQHFVIQETYYGDDVLIVDFTIDQAGQGEIAVYSLATGGPWWEFEGGDYYIYGSQGVEISPDNRVVAYETEADSPYITVFKDGFMARVPYPETCYELDCEPDADYWLGNDHLAVWDGENLIVRAFSSPETPLMTVSSDYPFRLEFGPDDREMLVVSASGVVVWSLEQPGTALIRLDVEPHGFTGFNNMLDRYVAQTGDMQVVYAVETNSPIIELPAAAVLNANMTQAAWWDGGSVRVWDSMTDQTLTIPVLEGYLGKVLDLDVPHGQAAFMGDGDTLGVVDLVDQTRRDIALSGTAEYVEFTADGTQFLGEGDFVSSSGEAFQTAVWSVDGVTDPLVLPVYPRLQISPSGDYVYSRDVPCESRSEMGEFFGIYRIDPPGIIPQYDILWDTLIYINGACGVSPVAFVGQRDIIYVGLGSRVTRVVLNEVFERFGIPSPTSIPQEVTVVDYSRSSRPDSVRSVAVSADERWLVVLTVFDRDGQTTQQAELFPLGDIVHNHPDSAVERIIPGAGRAAFSPDSAYIVTDTGVFPTVNGLEIPMPISLHTFTPDGRLLATYHNGLLNLWDLGAEDRFSAAIAQYQIEGVLELGFTDDQTALYLRRAGEVQVWRMH